MATILLQPTKKYSLIKTIDIKTKQYIGPYKWLFRQVVL